MEVSTIQEISKNQEYIDKITKLNDKFFQLNSIFDDIYYKFKRLQCYQTADCYHKPIAHKFPEFSDKLTDILDTIAGENFGWSVARPEWQEVSLKSLSKAAVVFLVDLQNTLNETIEFFEELELYGVRKLLKDILEDLQEMMLVPIKIEKFISNNNPNVIDLETFIDFNGFDR